MDIFKETEQLSRVPLFSSLDNAKLKLVAFSSERQTLADGQFLFHEGSVSDSVYVILEGVLEIGVDGTSGYEVILKQGKNEIVGEMGVINNAPRAASIRACGKTVVLKMEADTFMTLLRENSSMSLYVIRTLSDRIRDSLKRESDLINSQS